MTKTVHHGRNIKRMREFMGIRQEALAEKLGEEWSQRRISTLEDRDTIDDELLEQVANALEVPTNAIKNFNDESVFNIITNTFNDTASGVGYVNNDCTFNPLDKYVEAVEKNEKLYEALLKSERKKIALLEKMLKDKE